MLPETFGFSMLGVAINFKLIEMSVEYLLTVKVNGHCRMLPVKMSVAHDAYRLMQSKQWHILLVEGLMTIVADQPLVSLN